MRLDIEKKLHSVQKNGDRIQLNGNAKKRRKIKQIERKKKKEKGDKNTKKKKKTKLNMIKVKEIMYSK